MAENRIYSSAKFVKKNELEILSVSNSFFALQLKSAIFAMQKKIRKNLC